MKELVVATRNRKKIEEIRRILKGLDVRLLTLDDFPDCPEVIEDGDTFEHNALKKAREVSACSGKYAIADDSGLEVYALGGAPGVFSARYAGPEATDADNVHKLLKELGNITPENRGAAFVCVLALVGPGGVEVVFQGRVEGIIGDQPRGRSGFGYDPVFLPEGHERTFAEMSAEEKDSMSHRGRAMERFRQYLATRV
jgi:XTP/dITP diphosphohydrolase